MCGGFRLAGLQSRPGYKYSAYLNKRIIPVSLVFQFTPLRLTLGVSLLVTPPFEPARVPPLSRRAPSLQYCSIARPHSISPSPPVTVLLVRWLLVNTGLFTRALKKTLPGGHSTLRKKAYRRPGQVTIGLFQGHSPPPPTTPPSDSDIL